MNAAWASSLSTYKVAMGVGLHKGWAIEVRMILLPSLLVRR